MIGYVAKAMIHSKNAIGDVEIIGMPNEERQFKMKVLESGVVCLGIFNIFNGLYYADDVYCKVVE